MRFLPTTGDTMINTYFVDLTDGVTIKSPFIWECTRFCLAPNAERSVSREILLGTVEMGLQFGIKYFVGVFDLQMKRIYRRIGWSPEVIGEGVISGKKICTGLWPVSKDVKANLLSRLGNPLQPELEKSLLAVDARGLKMWVKSHSAVIGRD